MALRAGYYGLKNSVKKKLEKLAADMAGAKIIKTIGDGLNLTNAGKLNVTAASVSKLGGIKVGDGLSIEDGVLSLSSSGLIDYSTEEQDTGVLWIDGRHIFQKTYTGEHIPANNTILDESVAFDLIINAFGSQIWAATGQNYTFPYTGSNDIRPTISSAHKLVVTNGSNNNGAYWWTIQYVKVEEE